jgi:choline dehydrogenase-like flavoprotein
MKNGKENYSRIPHADAYAIGSGAGGAVLVKELVEAGKKVVLLKKGGYCDAEDMNQRESDLLRLF